MKKKIRYEEPQMPESLRKLMDIEPEQPRKKKKKKRPDRPTKKSQKSRYSQDRPTKTRQSQEKAGNKNRKTRPSQDRSEIPKKPAGQAKRNTAKNKARPNSKAQTPKNLRSRLDSERVSKKKQKPIQAKQRPAKNTKIKKRKSKNFGSIPSAILYGVILFINFLISGGDKDRYIKGDKREMLDKKFYRTLPLAFVGLMAIVMLAVLIHRDQPTSLAENRELEQRPKFTISSFVTGKYSSKQASYMSDQFPNRAGFIKAKANLDRVMGKKEINGVYLCSDGYLMEGFKAENPNITKAKVDAINKFASSNKSLKVSMMLVPNKVDIYSHLMPKNAPVDSQTDYIKGVASMLSNKIRMVDVKQAFNRMKNNEQLYYKTDHHWTTDGAFHAYSELCKTLNIQPSNEHNFNRSQASDSFRGSLYYKTGAEIGKPEDIYLYLPQDNAPVIAKYYDTKKKVPSLYDSSKLSGRDQYEVFTGGNHTQIKIRTNVETDRKLLLIKDSYANAMIPFLATTFSEINVVDMRYFTGSLSDVIHNNVVTDVLFLNNVNTFNSDSSILSINE